MAVFDLATLDASTVAFVLAVSFIAGTLSGLSGFGAGLLIALFITPIIGAKAVIPVLSVSMAITNASRVWLFRSNLAMRPIVLISATACPAAVLGALLYVRLESVAVQVMLGAGMLVIPMLMSAGVLGPALIASDAAIALAVNAVKIVAFGNLNALDLPLLVIALGVGLGTVPGTRLAAWIVKRTDVRLHTAFIEMLVVLGGSWMVWDALVEPAVV